MDERERVCAFSLCFCVLVCMCVCMSVCVFSDHEWFRRRRERESVCVYEHVCLCMCVGVLINKCLSVQCIYLNLCMFCMCMVRLTLHDSLMFACCFGCCMPAVSVSVKLTWHWMIILFDL